MLVSHRFGITETSEKTIEFNVLNELAAYLWSKFGLTLTVISPTQAEEDKLGFDDVIEGLPPGQVLAVQFKRPKEMIRPKDAVRFTLDTSQLNRLATNFSRNQAYVFLAPLPKNEQVVKLRRRLLTVTLASVGSSENGNYYTSCLLVWNPVLHPLRTERSSKP